PQERPTIRPRQSQGACVMQHTEQRDTAAQTATVVTFPLSRQVGRIRATAAVLMAIEEIDVADNCRHAIASDLFHELEALGHDEATQDEEVGAFFNEVELEMLRIEWETDLDGELLNG